MTSAILWLILPALGGVWSASSKNILPLLGSYLLTLTGVSMFMAYGSVPVVEAWISEIVAPAGEGWTLLFLLLTRMVLSFVVFGIAGSVTMLVRTDV